jgi:hypothetical protein
LVVFIGAGRVGTVSAISQSIPAAVRRAKVQGTTGCANMRVGRRGGTLAGASSPWKRTLLRSMKAMLLKVREALKMVEHYGEIMDRAG